jgi:hypothetical protein
MMDIFDINGPEGKHQCIVHEPLLTSLLHFQATFNPPRLSEDLVRGAVQQLLFALDFLHTEAHVIHTGILLFLSWQLTLLTSIHHRYTSEEYYHQHKR